MAESRIDRRFAELRAEARQLDRLRHGGRPEPRVCREILSGLPASRADMIEIACLSPTPWPTVRPFKIPAAGRKPAVRWGPPCAWFEISGATIIDAGCSMGYFNPIYSCRIDAFIADAIEAGADGLIS